LSIYTWGDYDNPEILTNFTAQIGPEIHLDSYGSNEEMIAKLTAAKGTAGYDIVIPTGPFIPQMVENGLLQKLDKAAIPNIEHMDPDFLGRAWDTTNEYSICKAWGTTGFVYDTTVITRELTTWNDFIDAAKNEASGSTSLLDDPYELAGIYFWANGINWNTTDPAELDACEQFLVNDLAPHVVAFDSYPGGGAIPQGTAALLQAWNGDARQGIMNSDEPDRWRWVLGAPATEIWMDNWAIAAGAPHPNAANAFINFVLTPENQLLNVDYIGYHTGAKDIEQKARDAGLEMLELIFLTPEQIATMQEGEVNEAQARVVDIYTKMKAAASA
jgi:spermidine/putrescine transport system substrate-binding protein